MTYNLPVGTFLLTFYFFQNHSIKFFIHTFFFCVCCFVSRLGCKCFAHMVSFRLFIQKRLDFDSELVSTSIQLQKGNNRRCTFAKTPFHFLETTKLLRLLLSLFSLIPFNAKKFKDKSIKMLKQTNNRHTQHTT